MGQVTIEIPQNINRAYHVDDSKFSKRILDELDDFEKSSKPKKLQNVVPPRRNSLKEDGEAVLGIWADREESAEETARKIRDRNNGKIE